MPGRPLDEDRPGPAPEDRRRRWGALAGLSAATTALAAVGALLLVPGSAPPAGATSLTAPDLSAASSSSTMTMTQPPAGAPTAASPLQPAAGATGQPLHDPGVIRSRNGSLHVTLVASEQTVEIAGRPILAKVYNGSWVAPTLVLSPGDHVTVDLVNHLTEPTNLHFHGLDVTPTGDGDNIFVSVDPGRSFRYRFTVPKQAQAGTDWYHSHEMVPAAEMSRYPDTDSEEQVFDGLSGLIEVEGLRSELPRAERHITEHYLALRDVQVMGGAIESAEINSDAATTRLLDGEYQPRLRIAPGETQLWHLANIGADIFYALQWAGHTFEVIGQDGHPVIHPIRETMLVLPPGKRWDVLVQGGPTGTSQLRTLTFHQGDDTYPARTLAAIDTTGRSRPPLPTPRAISWATVDLRLARIVRRRTVVFSENTTGTQFFIDGKSYDPSRIDFRARLGTVEEWTIVNHTDEIHPFHLHTFQTQEISENGIPLPFDGDQDEVPLPPGGYVVVRVRFADHTGETVFHCHILAHEDAGMMATVLVSR